MPYTSDKPTPARSAEELRAAIPGWGVDADPADRPAVPRERPAAGESGAHWDFPELQPAGREHRERSIEHAILPPVFGTSQPLAGVSGTVRRLAYRRFSEARAAHWLLLLAADRVDAAEHRVRAWASGSPGVPPATGLRAEVTYGGVRSRWGRGRADLRHQWMDPLVVGAPWIVAGAVLWRVLRGPRAGRRD